MLTLGYEKVIGLVNIYVVMVFLAEAAIGGAVIEEAESLAARSKFPHVFPVYHITAYPSFRIGLTNASGLITHQIRTNWCPD